MLYNTYDEKITSYRITLSTASSYLKPTGEVTTMISDSIEIVEKNTNPFDHIITEIEKTQTLVNV